MNRVKNLNEFAFRSNKLSKDILGISGDIAKNEWDYDPNAVNEIKTIAQTPLKQLGGMAVIDPLRYKRQADPNLIIKALYDVYKLGEANATPSGQIVDRSGLKYSVKKADPTFINNALVQRIQNDPQALQSLSVLYRRTTGDNNPTTEKLTGFLKDQYETRYKYDYLGNAMQPRVGKDDDEDSYNYPVELTIPFADGKGNVNVKDYVKLPLPRQNFAGSGYIDMYTGKPSNEILDSSNDYEVVGVANFPFIKSGSTKDKSLWGTLAQPTFAEKNQNAVQEKPMVHVQKITNGIKEDLLIPYDRLPRSKKVNKALSNFKPSSGSNSSPAKTQTKTKGAYAGLDADGNPIFK
jgi:hypothetical protein